MSKPFTSDDCDFIFVYGSTSGISPVTESPDADWRVSTPLFFEHWDWTLYNNGLVMNYQTILN